ncbi:MAG: head decoration protein [Sulfurimonas sp.]|nr:head decoration protein [Sulfurimonas sp.]
MGATTEVYTPDNLIAGDGVRTDSVTIISGENLVRGAVLGKITASGKYNLSLSAAGDGSETAYSILAEDCNASGGDVTNVPVYIRGRFNSEKLTIGTGHTVDTIKPQLRDAGIDLATSVVTA